MLAEKFGDDPDEDWFLNSPKTKVLILSSAVEDDKKAVSDLKQNDQRMMNIEFPVCSVTEFANDQGDFSHPIEQNKKSFHPRTLCSTMHMDRSQVIWY